MTKEQSLIDDIHLSSMERAMYNHRMTSKTIEEETNSYQRDHELVRWCVNHVPTPPLNYHFSLRQKMEQYEFFRHRSDVYLSRFLDLYNSSIVIACLYFQ